MKNNDKIKEDAEVFILGLVNGYTSKDEVIKWADKIITNSESPPYEIIEIASSKSIENILSKLKEVKGQYNWNCVLKRFLGLLYDSLSKDNSKAKKISHQLYTFMLNCEHIIPSDLEQNIYYFDDGFDLAEQGIYGRIDDLTKELLEFLKKESNKALG